MEKLSATGGGAGWRVALGSWWVRIGLVILLFGMAPLLLIIVAAAVGWWPDPNPNPIGPGLLFMLSFWPGVICVIIGVIRTRSPRQGEKASTGTRR